MRVVLGLRLMLALGLGVGLGFGFGLWLELVLGLGVRSRQGAIIRRLSGAGNMADVQHVPSRTSGFAERLEL